MHTIGKIDTEKYRVVSEHIRTSDVIITEERIQHIKEHHPNDYERYVEMLNDMYRNPQYILEDPSPATAVILKEYSDTGEYFRMILRLATEDDDPTHKNSIITFMKINQRNFKKYIRNKKILYKSE